MWQDDDCGAKSGVADWTLHGNIKWRNGCSLSNCTGHPSMTVDTLSEGNTAKRSSSRSKKHSLGAFQKQEERKQGGPS